MLTLLRTSLPSRVFLIALLAAFLRVGSLAAEDCPAVYDWGAPRDCTLTEHFGHCLDTAMVSYSQCRHAHIRGSWCVGGAVFDLVGCEVKLPIWIFFK